MNTVDDYLKQPLKKLRHHHTKGSQFTSRALLDKATQLIHDVDGAKGSMSSLRYAQLCNLAADLTLEIGGSRTQIEGAMKYLEYSESVFGQMLPSNRPASDLANYFLFQAVCEKSLQQVDSANKTVKAGLAELRRNDADGVHTERLERQLRLMTHDIGGLISEIGPARRRALQSHCPDVITEAFASIKRGIEARMNRHSKVDRSALLTEIRWYGEVYRRAYPFLVEVNRLSYVKNCGQYLLLRQPSEPAAGLQKLWNSYQDAQHAGASSQAWQAANLMHAGLRDKTPALDTFIARDLRNEQLVGRVVEEARLYLRAVRVAPRFKYLTVPEREIFEDLMKGCSNATIAKNRGGIKLDTVTKKIRHICETIGLESDRQLLALFIDLKVDPPAEPSPPPIG